MKVWVHCSFCGTTAEVAIPWPIPTGARLVCACGIGCWEPTAHIDGQESQ